MSDEIKCSKENPCQECKEEQKKQLAKIEDWEVNRKAKIERFEFIEVEFCHNRNSSNDKIRYGGDDSYNYNWEKCSHCNKVIKTIKSNDCGDRTVESEDANHSCQVEVDNQIKSNQIKSNQIKSNQSSSLPNSTNSTNSLNSQNLNNHKLYLGIGLGILGMGILGLIGFFVFRKKGE